MKPFTIKIRVQNQSMENGLWRKTTGFNEVSAKWLSPAKHFAIHDEPFPALTHIESGFAIVKGSSTRKMQAIAKALETKYAKHFKGLRTLKACRQLPKKVLAGIRDIINEVQA